MEQMEKKSRATHARTLIRSGSPTVEMRSDESASDLRREAIIERKNKSKSVGDMVAGDSFYYLNWYYPGGREAWPQHNNLRTVLKYYPFAEGGPLLVDEPRFHFEFEACEMKKKVLAELGYRYLVVRPKMTVEEAIEELKI